MFGPRQWQLDFRVSKRFRFDAWASRQLDVSNLTNASTATGIVTTYGRIGSDRQDFKGGGRGRSTVDF